jgi:hypothetical protein
VLDFIRLAAMVLMIQGHTLAAVLLRDGILRRSRPLGLLIHATALLLLAGALIW